MTTQQKLSDTQLVILNAACSRDDRYVFPIPVSVRARGGALHKVLAKGMVETVPAGLRDAEWTRSDDEPITLRATDAAFEALGIEPDTAAPGATQGDEPGASTEAATEPEPATDAPAARKPRKARDDSEQARLIEMLRRPEGASIAEIAEAFGWQQHAVRGAIAGTLKKKLGLDVAAEKVEGRGTVYRLPQEG